jgi:hypothetical protein
MSTFTKRVPDKSDASGATTKLTAPKAPAAPPPPATMLAESPKAPAVVVSRSVDVGGGAGAPRSRPFAPSRPIIPPIAIPPPVATPPLASRPAPVPKPAPTPPSPAMPTTTGKMERPTSVRPAAPDVGLTNGAQASIADTFERMLSDDDVDASLSALGASGSATAHGAPPTDLTEVRALFAQLAANHVRQVRDFMIDLRSGEATADWIAICEPALRSLRRAAERLDFAPLCEALDRLADALTAARATGVRSIQGAGRAPLLACYDELVALMPQAFALDLDRSQRETVILQALLLQVPEVKKVTIDRLYAAGLTTLEAMFLANTADLAITAGIPEEVARLIVERFRAYRQQVSTTVPDATRASERERLAALVAKLRREHDGHERAAESWSADASEQKRELRRARTQTLLDIQVVMARLGEVDRLAELDRLPFEKKMTRLEAFLDEAREKYARQT